MGQIRDGVTCAEFVAGVGAVTRGFNGPTKRCFPVFLSDTIYPNQSGSMVATYASP